MSNAEYRKVIFDASSLIAVIAKEKGYKEIRPYLSKGVISTVNLSEVYKYCVGKQEITEFECKLMLKIASVDIHPFTDEQAMVVAKMINITKKYGISFADRACIGLAMITGFPIVTCDRIWSKLDLDIKIICPR